MASDFPSDLLVAIFRLLPTTAIIRCASVCTAWCSAASATLHPSVPRPPELMLTGTTPTSATFLSLSSGHLHTITNLPSISDDRLWIGSSAGWLVTAGSSSELHLVNPLTRTELTLPSIATLPDVSAVCDPSGRLAGYRCGERVLTPGAVRCQLFDKAVVGVAAPGAPPTVVLVMAGPTPGLAWARPGDSAWTALRTASVVHDVVVHSGRFWSVDARGLVEVWDAAATGGIVPAPPRPVSTGLPGVFVDRYLVVVEDRRLVQVWRAAGGRFRVFEMAGGGVGWTEVRELGEWAVFLGSGGSTAVSSREFPELRGNCIYYTEGYGFFQAKGCGSWVYSLEDGSTKPFYCVSDRSTDWPHPIWFTPSL